MKILMTGKALDKFLLTRQQSDADRTAKLQAIIKWVSENATIEAFVPQCTMVLPRNEKSKPFYILKLTSVVHANYLRLSKSAMFEQQGLFIGKDLEITEQDSVSRIRAIVNKFWGVEFFPRSCSGCDKLKCCINGNPRAVLLSLSKVEDYVKASRIYQQ